METAKLKKFAQFARRSLIEQVSAKLKLVLAEDSTARRESAEAVKKLEEQIKAHSKEQVIERVAYIWFNRFCALRFMDVNRYTRIGVVSPVEGQFQPEILAEAKMGYIDEDMVPEKTRQQIFALLEGKAPSRDPQSEAYRRLVVAACNSWNKAMSFLFERIADYTELLMPDDLLSGNSILAYTREAMTPDACKDVEVIGWLYQFYISEKKDEVFEGLKKNKKITPLNIPAATQLFTPHWIVKYLVENSLGRLWMLNKPNSKLVERMEYYIPPVDSGERSVASGQWLVASKEGVGCGEQLQTDRPAEGNATAGGDQPNVGSSSQKSGHWPLATSHLKISSPEEIRICDPACGSGHMLTYAFDLLYAIYEEEGYEPNEIPEKILTHNLYGIEIDERAGELAAFALTMKARAKQRRFFRKPVQPKICVLENVDLTTLTTEHTENTEWKKIIDGLCKTGINREDLIHDLRLFVEADNFGSLLCPRLSSEQAIEALDLLESYDQSFKTPTFEHRSLVIKCRKALQQADYLSRKYHVVIANPPYMGGKGMNGRLGAWLKDNYADVKSDLFSAFIVRNTELALPKGQLGFMSPFVWMFISSYEKLRSFLINQKTITSLVQLEYSGFDGATVPICTFTVENAHHLDFKGGYVRLSDFRGSENQDPKTLEAIKNPDCGWFYRASAADFKKIPGSPIAYWVSERMRDIFENGTGLRELVTVKQGMATSDNNRFIRSWFEASLSNIAFDCNSLEESESRAEKWYPYNKGGDFRKWYGNNELLVNWWHNGAELKEFQSTLNQGWNVRLKSRGYYFKPSVTWTFISSAYFGVRYSKSGFIFDVGGSSAFPDEEHIGLYTAYFCSKMAYQFLRAVNPTLNFQVENIAILPVLEKRLEPICKMADGIFRKCIAVSKDDWDSYETSWDFTELPLLSGRCSVVSDQQEKKLTTNHWPLATKLSEAYAKLRAHWLEMTLEMQRLEEENNRIFIEAYGLQDELTPEVPLEEITLTCNPYYRYGKKAGISSVDSGQWPVVSEKIENSLLLTNRFPLDKELEERLVADTMKEFISYAVGCMFGRYSLDKPGLILANQGETVADFICRVTSDQWLGARGQRLVTSGQWLGASEEGDEYGEKLQGSDHLAESGRFGSSGLSDNQAISERGALRSDQSDTQSGSVGSLEHSRGSSSSIHSGIQKLSVDSSGFTGRSGDATVDCQPPELSDPGTALADHDNPPGSQQNAARSDEQTSHWPLATSHLSFPPDDDNVIPMLDGDWFPDDISERFRKFLRVTFGEEYYEENLKFIEKAIGKDIRKYFLKDFYNDHVKRYKKRPIYWLFSSPKGSFNALIYMHRYRPDTVSVVLNDYLRELRTKLTARKNHLEAVSISAGASQGEKTKALKEIESLKKMIDELDTYEREVLYPLATEQVEIDLDDGVKVNYQKFGAALKKIPGLDAQES